MTLIVDRYQFFCLFNPFLLLANYSHLTLQLRNQIRLYSYQLLFVFHSFWFPFNYLTEGRDVKTADKKNPDK